MLVAVAACRVTDSKEDAAAHAAVDTHQHLHPAHSSDSVTSDEEGQDTALQSMAAKQDAGGVSKCLS